MASAKRKQSKKLNLDVIEGGNGAVEAALSEIPQHPKTYSRDLPVSGAWFPGDPVGHRKFINVTDGRPFALEAGGILPEVVQAYETWGKLNSDSSNAVLVCHALTGDSHVSGDSSASHPTKGWWDEVVGPGKAINTEEFFVVCVNVLGGCQGSTGPSSLNPANNRSYGSTFPNVTIRDIVRAQAKVADHLGIDQWHAVIGGSMGGMQVLEWAAMFPNRVSRISPVATSLAASAQQIAWSAVGRASIALDPRWREGNYYEADPGDGPHAGLAIARAIAQIHYRSDESFDSRFGRDLVDRDSLFGLWDRFEVESYLDYHGEKLIRRFDANSYLVLNRAMDTHDLARGRGSLKDAASRIEAKVATASITTDILYPPQQQKEIQRVIESVGGTCSYVEIDDPNGHDGFLLATTDISAIFRRVLET
ncbi:MAG: homoserine O-acetyltransferase [Acidimicrobiaceae bacterium]|jgi:homoserine O-acetyltransferase|nr:homoserine O-acetyltransferase [Acidimicrobiaceae bacterium]|tara:strand:- start:116004 stop:117266 length:1263 start_codon:yes stop_codon:yes gene_type:complete